MKVKNLLKAGAVAGSAAAAGLFCIGPGKATDEQKAPFDGRNFAHRGLHTRDKSVPENSIEAFRRAAENGYGVELDVQLSKDGQVVVFHDPSLKRVCGVDADVSDKDYSELRQMRLNDTEFGIPLLTEVLKVIDGRGPVICEVKPGKKNRELCEKTYEIISGYKGDICVESFHPMIVGWFRFHAPEILRGQLSGPTKNFKSSTMLQALTVSQLLLNCVARPQFIAYELDEMTIPVRINYMLGCMKVRWTSHEPRNEKGQDAVIFEYYKPKPFFKK